MKRILLTSLTLVLIIGAILYIFKGSPGTPFRRLHLNGDAQFLIGYSEVKKQILYGGIHFPQEGFIINVYRHDGTRPCGNFVYCDYLSDTSMLTFDTKSVPFVLDLVTGGEKRLDIDFSFSEYELYNNIEACKYKDETGFLFNAGDSLFFYNIANKTSKKLFSAGPSQQITSFDRRDQDILVCVKDFDCPDGRCTYHYNLIDSEGTVNSISHITAPVFTPLVRWLDHQVYLTNFYDGQSHLLFKSVGTDSTLVDMPIGDQRVLSLLPADDMIYMTLMNEERRAINTKNPFKDQYSGVSIASIDVPTLTPR